MSVGINTIPALRVLLAQKLAAFVKAPWMTVGLNSQAFHSEAYDKLLNITGRGASLNTLILANGSQMSV